MQTPYCNAGSCRPNFACTNIQQLPLRPHTTATRTALHTGSSRLDPNSGVHPQVCPAALAQRRASMGRSLTSESRSLWQPELRPLSGPLRATIAPCARHGFHCGTSNGNSSNMQRASFPPCVHRSNSLHDHLVGTQTHLKAGSRHDRDPADVRVGRALLQNLQLRQTSSRFCMPPTTGGPSQGR